MRRLPFVLYNLLQLPLVIALPQIFLGHGIRDFFECLLLAAVFSIPLSAYLLRRNGLPLTTSAERYHRRLQTKRQTRYGELQAGREFWATASQAGRGRAAAQGA